MRWNTMNMNNIERNQLDYILTDVLPSELSEQFSYRYFYEYLITKSTEINKIISLVKKKKNDNTEKMFDGCGNWRTIPLSYTIMKQLRSKRSISLLQPLGALQLFLFVTAYQKEILTLLQQKSVFSLRYHKQNNDLYYKNKNKSVTSYFIDMTEKTGKEIIEQTGMYFDVGPYKSIANFTSSEEWLLLNSKYKYFIKTDFKACFDSIYTHTFKWIIAKDVNDAKNFKNSNIYTTIDRILMNVNALTSNGIVVGPEFSRMVAELLLQNIDCEVCSKLLEKGVVVNENYNVYRFVDDVFIFADSEELATDIVDLYSHIARKFLLDLNEKKEFRKKVPFVLETWLNDTNLFTNRVVALLFNSNSDINVRVNQFQQEHTADDEKTHLLKSKRLSTSKRTIMNQANELICKYEDNSKTIVAYFLGTILNKVGRNKDKYRIFESDVSERTVFEFMELVIYVYSFFPNFSNTQKLLSIISYIKDEFKIYDYNDELQRLFEKYRFIFEKADLNDVVNLILFCRQAKIEIPHLQEEKIVKCLYEKDDPVLWATYLLYSDYSQKYYREIRDLIGRLLIERLDSIVNKNSIYTYREFWWVLVFNKSPHITEEEQTKINEIINELKNSDAENDPGIILGKIFIDFLKTSTKQFFEWDIYNKDLLRSITFKTRQRSIYKNYKEKPHSLYWSSI